jgi:hypothetical protein
MTLTSPPEAPPGLATAAGRWKWLATLYPEHPQALEFTPLLMLSFRLAMAGQSLKDCPFRPGCHLPVGDFLSISRASLLKAGQPWPKLLALITHEC